MEGDWEGNSLVLRDWEQIQSPSTEEAQAHSEEAQAHAHAHAHARGWEMVACRDILYGDCSIFPPSSHEGLHIPLEQQHQENQEEEDGPPTPEPQSSPSNFDEEGQDPPRQQFDSQLRLAGDFLMNRLSLGFEVVCTKFINLVSSARSYTLRRGANSSFPRLAGVTIAFLVSSMYLRWQWRRRRSRQEKKDRLILLIREQDVKINQLLDQIAQLNEVLLSDRHKGLLRSC